MLFEILTPSDTCTMEADDFEIACVACLAVGQGCYGLREIDGDKEMPMVAFWGKHADTWFVEQFGHGMQESVTVCMEHKSAAIVACLESVLLGRGEDRRLYADAMAAITDETKRAEFAAKYHDKKRSSVNDICAVAWRLAAQLKESTQPAATHSGPDKEENHA